MQLAFLPSEGSPIRRQYLALKRQHQDAILFFQLGDFYETFEEDARTVADVCDVVLTSREMGRGERLPMAGVPVHAAETYIGRLVERGYHVAICQQIEDPATAAARGPQSVVRREVTRVITPGTLVDPALLAPARSNYLVAVASDRHGTGLAYGDISTGEFACAELRGSEHREAARSELWRLEPAECLVLEEETARPLLPPTAALTRDATLFADPDGTLCAHFQVASLGALGLADQPLAASAAAAIVRYTARTHPPATSLLEHLRVYDPHGYMVLDATTRDHLEVRRSLRGRKEGSLLHALDRTRSAMGARLLAEWLGHPLIDRPAIERRLDVVAALLHGDPLRTKLQERLGDFPDLQRLAGRARQRLLSPREAIALARGIERAEALGASIRESSAPALTTYGERIRVPDYLAQEIREKIAEDPPSAFGEGVIRPGQVPELDELRSHARDGRQWLLDLERRERERTGLKNLKVGYNRVFGYYLEVSSAALKGNLDYYRRQETGAETVAQLLEQLGYQRRQTMTNAERFLLPELRDYELRQARSVVRMVELERQAFEDLLDSIAARASDLLEAAAAIAEIDTLGSFAESARDCGYTRPEILDEAVTEIVGGRHPVVERSLPWGAYIPNDVHLAAVSTLSPTPPPTLGEGQGVETQRSVLGPQSSVLGPQSSGLRPQVIILTGPNMAGKTTYGRMALLICLMAQCGSYVPAERARLGLADRLFLRSGANDDISLGQSTFMVEMTETAAILRNATPKSVAFFDEVGRGTSTYDGMALARAIVEYLAASPGHGCRALFSTHYHELADIEAACPAVQNYRMDVLEAADHVSFTYRVVRGSTDRSYGVHVARLAGLPPSVVGRAEAVLGHLEAQARGARHKVEKGPAASPLMPHASVARLADLNVDSMTPLEALNTLARLRAEAHEEIEIEEKRP